MKRILNTYGILLLSKVVLLYRRLIIAIRGERFETPRTFFVAGVSDEETEASVRLHG
jgi:hypothetical protein